GLGGQNRTLGPARNFLGNAPQEKPARARPPACPHTDQTRSDVGRRFEDRVRRVPFCDAVVDFHVPAGSHEAVQYGPCPLPVFFGALANLDALRAEGSWGHVKGYDSGAAVTRHGASQWEYGIRSFRKVRGKEDRVNGQHGSLLVVNSAPAFAAGP